MYIGICIRQSCNRNNSFILQINNCKTGYLYQVRISPYIPRLISTGKLINHSNVV